MKALLPIVIAAAAVGIGACGGDAKTPAADFVRADSGRFAIGDSILPRYAGVNMWYAAILASDGRGGDRARLARELDMLRDAGVTNIRVLAGGDGPEGLPSHIEPALQVRAGVYNDTLLAGLDRLLAELESRGMTATLYLGNAWEWSGGYGSYLEWAGAGRAPIPSVDGWTEYMEFAGRFLANDSAKALFADHVRAIVGRTSSVTGRPYAESPAIFSWQVANEPRAFSGPAKPLLRDWIHSVARLIKSIDPAHMVSVGSEGSHGCEQDINLWAEIHSIPEIDYATIHIWPYNWGWVDSATLVSRVDTAIANARAYIGAHAAIARRLGKPLVMEEFGYPRDGMSLAPGSPTVGRDSYLSAIASDSSLAGTNIWGWGGEAVARHDTWQPGDPYTGDPAQEPQGLNSVFATDTSTIAIIRRANR